MNYSWTLSKEDKSFLDLMPEKLKRKFGGITRAYEGTPLGYDGDPNGNVIRIHSLLCGRDHAELKLRDDLAAWLKKNESRMPQRVRFVEMECSYYGSSWGYYVWSSVS